MCHRVKNTIFKRKFLDEKLISRNDSIEVDYFFETPDTDDPRMPTIIICLFAIMRMAGANKLMFKAKLFVDNKLVASARASNKKKARGRRGRWHPIDWRQHQRSCECDHQSFGGNGQSTNICFK